MAGITSAELAAPLVDGATFAETSAEDAAWCFSRITFSWVGGIIQEGYKRERRRAQQSDSTQTGPLALTDKDLLQLRSDDMAECLSEKAQQALSEEQREERPSLVRVLRRAFGGPFMFAAAFKIVYDSLQMAGPYILKAILHFLDHCDGSSPSQCTFEEGMSYVALMLLSAAVQTMVLHQYFHRCFRTGMRFNVACISLVYNKSLKVDGASKSKDSKQRTSGEIVNLMAVDSQRLQDFAPQLHPLWSSPYQIIITLIFLHWVVGWATLAGLSVMLVQIPAVAVVARRIRLAQRKLMTIKDERIKLTNEAFGSIRLLKMYGWEDSFETRLDGVREMELKQLRKYQILNIISSAMWATAPILTALATFAVYCWLYKELTASTAFTAVALFNVLRFPLTMFPQAITTVVEAKVAIRRLEDFLCAPEIPGRSRAASKGFAVEVRDAELAWPNGSPLLSKANFTVPAPVEGQQTAHMTVVLGAVGAGKSGLLQALIGDLSPMSGIVSTAGQIAYTSQVSWIRNASVRDNIIFNSSFQEDRYKAVIKACCLLPDLEALPNGDMTEIGEKGVNLSGGQKQRISLARAVYSQADLMLLDDPLSAVDSHVAKKLLKMFKGPLLSRSSIVLCTHHLQAVHSADQIILLSRSASQQTGADPSDVSLDLEAESLSSSAESTDKQSTQPVPKIAFCGSLADFQKAFPKLVAKRGDGDAASFERQTSDEPTPSEKKSSEAGKLVQKEEEQIGSVPTEVYGAYISAAGGTCVGVAVVFGVLCGQGLQSVAAAWLSYWSDHNTPKSVPHITSLVGLLGYGGLSITAFTGIFLTSALFRMTALKAARAFHRKLLANLLRLPMTFFDTTPLGRVLNRFSKDIYTIDEVLVNNLYSYLQVSSVVVCTIIVISVATPWFLVIIFPLLLLYRATQNFYIPASRQLKRIESNLRSPIFSHFSETLDGTALIRAYGQQDIFISESLFRVSRSMRAYYSNMSSNRWLAVRLESFGAAITFCAGTLAVLGRNSISAGVAGLSISYALSVTQALNWVVRMAADRETNIVSVERVREYLRLDPEPPHHQTTDPSPQTWPREGAIEFKDVYLRYRPDLPYVLSGLNLSIRGREKIGICGRTGAGKSSVLNVLLRLVEAGSGNVFLDGLDIKTLGLHCLRHSLTIIPQDPILFSGSLRFNLDPVGEASDASLWQSLQRSHLSDHVSTLDNGHGDRGLESVVQEQGKNFSLGQRQQMCLARALLRSNVVLLLDEATSAVDRDTDNLIQETIRSEFAGHTVLCIAHRISTIMHSDRVCVLDAGKVVELASPQDLMKDASSHFAKLAKLDAMA
eukprot:s1985_g4.t1